MTINEIYLPLSIVNYDNTIRTGTKSKFKDAIKKQFGGIYNNIDELLNYVIIYDASIIFYSIPSTISNDQAFEFIYKTYIKNKLNYKCKEIHLVFDNLDLSVKIKKQIQEIREKKEIQNKFFKNREERDLFIKNFINWLKLKENKHYNSKIIISGLTNKDNSLIILKDNCLESNLYNHKHGEADSAIWYHANITNYKNIIIISADTDIWVIGLLHFNKLNKNIIIKNNKQYININEIIKNIENKFKNINNCVFNIVYLYIISGCDYISFFYYLTKEHFLNVFIKYIDYIVNPNFPSFLYSKEHIKINYNMWYKMISLCYYEKYKKYFDQDIIYMPGKHCANYVYNILKNKLDDDKKIIPKFEALEAHLKRSEYVINTWYQALNKEINYFNPELYGWIYENGILRFKHNI
jgi:hypothetical protein